MTEHRQPPHHEPDDFEQAIIDAIAKALGERKVRFTDRRLLLMWGILIGILALVLVYVGRLDNYVNQAEKDRTAFERQIISNCLSFNHFISTIQTTTSSSHILSAQEKRERVRFYEAAKQKCPPPPKR